MNTMISTASIAPSTQELKIVNPHNQVKKVPGTQQELDKMGVKIKIEQFKSGAINKPVSIPNTYERLKQHPAGPEQITSSMVEGAIE
ncbi:arginine:ornithine antiporter, partial [Staphylococcus aureus]